MTMAEAITYMRSLRLTSKPQHCCSVEITIRKRVLWSVDEDISYRNWNWMSHSYRVRPRPISHRPDDNQVCQHSIGHERRAWRSQPFRSSPNPRIRIIEVARSQL